jgi:hypothetical protein
MRKYISERLTSGSIPCWKFLNTSRSDMSLRRSVRKNRVPRGSKRRHLAGQLLCQEPGEVARSCATLENPTGGRYAFKRYDFQDDESSPDQDETRGRSTTRHIPEKRRDQRGTNKGSTWHKNGVEWDREPASRKRPLALPMDSTAPHIYNAGCKAKIRVPLS